MGSTRRVNEGHLSVHSGDPTRTRHRCLQPNVRCPPPSGQSTTPLPGTFVRLPIEALSLAPCPYLAPCPRCLPPLYASTPSMVANFYVAANVSWWQAPEWPTATDLRPRLHWTDRIVVLASRAHRKESAQKGLGIYPVTLIFDTAAIRDLVRGYGPCPSRSAPRAIECVNHWMRRSRPSRCCR